MMSIYLQVAKGTEITDSSSLLLSMSLPSVLTLPNITLSRLNTSSSQKINDKSGKSSLHSSLPIALK